MKIGVIGHKRVPSREGGIEKTIEKQMLRMRDRGHEVVFYNRSGHNIFGAEYDENDRLSLFEGTKIETVYTPKGSLGVPVYSFLATLKALEEKCDIIYYHGSGSCRMIPLAKIRGAKCAAMLHGIDSLRVKWNRYGKYYLSKGEKAAAKKADVCFVLSENIKDYIKKKYGREPIVTFNGTEPPQINEAGDEMIRERYGVGKDDYILTLVRIDSGKGIQYLIRAFRDIETDKKLIIAGGADPACMEYYRELKALAGKDDRIIFTGYVQEPVVTALYRNAYMYVFPSDQEGMAHSLLEAMAAGCCCLVSDIPENVAVVEEYGAVFKKADTEDLKEKIKILLSDPEKVSAYKQNAAGHVLGKYDWDRCTDQVEEAFYSALKAIDG